MLYLFVTFQIINEKLQFLFILFHYFLNIFFVCCFIFLFI